MNKFFKIETILIIVCKFSLLFLCLLFLPISSFAADSLCARVKIEIRQELILERQAFDAHMRINNGPTDISLENVFINVNFADEDGNGVMASSDPDNTDALFFIRLDSLENINDIDGSGTVAPSTSADIHWLIIPAPGASNGVPQGTLYLVGATLGYTMGGEDHIMNVNPDYIFVKPMPELLLDYFLPRDVYGDDAFTQEIEPEVPFSLGVRILNNGTGTARNLKIDSAQPKITENDQGLLIGFNIEGSEVNGNPATESLMVDFGDIAPSATGVARWIMTCSLSGQFVEFTANYTHSNELGGELTSLLEAVNTHFLVHDVLVDLPGRDNIRDFLAEYADGYRLYESEGMDFPVTDQSASSSLQISGQSGTEFTYTLTTVETAGFMYVKLPDPHSGAKAIKEVIRSDGNIIKPDNAWLSKTRDGNDVWQYFFNLFDVDTTDSYTIVFDDPADVPQAPVLQFIPDRTTTEGQQLSFIVTASDPDGTIPTLSATPIPPLATFTDNGNGTATFDWTPLDAQQGGFEITFVASDGNLTDSRVAVISVCPADDSDCDGMLDDCELAYFGNLDRNGNGDYDGDGISDRDECLNGTSPMGIEVQLSRGLNLFGYPMQIPAGYTSYNLLASIGNENEVDKIQRYNPDTGVFETTSYLNGVAIGDEFAINNGAGYYVYMKSEKTIAFNGVVVCPAINLVPGLNIVSVPCTSPDLTSYDLLLYLGSPDDVISVQGFITPAIKKMNYAA